MYNKIEKRSVFFTSRDSDVGLKSPETTSIKAVLFDIFGTVVDMRGSMSKIFRTCFKQKELTYIDCDEFVDSWIEAYSENMGKLSEGNDEFVLVDDLNRLALFKILKNYGIYELFSDSERDDMWRTWRRLDPWPDSVSAIPRLKEQFTVGPLSNGNISLLKKLSRHAGLDWDIILSGETFRCYKPNPLVYNGAAKELNLDPSEILLVASHKYDLEAAKLCGFNTAYIVRQDEDEPNHEDELSQEDKFDFIVKSLDDLADKLMVDKIVSLSHFSAS